MVALLDIGAREARRERVGRVRGDPAHLLHHRGSTADCLCISWVYQGEALQIQVMAQIYQSNSKQLLIDERNVKNLNLSKLRCVPGESGTSCSLTEI